MRQLKLIIAAVFIIAPFAAKADVINITTPQDILSQPSYTFGDYIFELVTPTNLGFNLITRVEDFIVSNAAFGMDFSLRRLDNAVFSLLGLRHGGSGTTNIGGVSLAHNGNQNFQDFAFAGQGGVTNVNSIRFSPSDFIQISAFDVVSKDQASAVPEPGTLALLGIGLFGMGLASRKKSI